MAELLTTAEIDAALTALRGWSHDGSSLRASYTFRDFRQAFAFMTAVAAEAEQQNHHPDWRNVWSRVDISLSTHDAGGITERDLALARRIAAIAQN